MFPKDESACTLSSETFPLLNQRWIRSVFLRATYIDINDLPSHRCAVMPPASVSHRSDTLSGDGHRSEDTRRPLRRVGGASPMVALSARSSKARRRCHLCRRSLRQRERHHRQIAAVKTRCARPKTLGRPGKEDRSYDKCWRFAAPVQLFNIVS